MKKGLIVTIAELARTPKIIDPIKMKIFFKIGFMN